MPEEPVTLWRYRDLPEALIAKAKLESADIGCFLADENMIRLSWFWSNALGGLRLQVSDADAGYALALMGEEIPASFSAEEIGEEYVQPVCPACQSRDVSFEPFNRSVALLFLWFISLPVWIPTKSWKCEDCGRRWKAEYD